MGQLRYDLNNGLAQQLRGAWETAKSILNRKELILEVSTSARCTLPASICFRGCVNQGSASVR